MNPTFGRLYRQLGRATFGLLLAGLSVYALTLLCGLLGVSHSVVSFRRVVASLEFVFVGPRPGELPCG